MEVPSLYGDNFGLDSRKIAENHQSEVGQLNFKKTLKSWPANKMYINLSIS